MIVTPQELDRRAQFYRELGQMTDAGLSVMKALETVSRHARGPLRGVIQRIHQSLNQGSSLAEAFLCAGRWLSPFDIALLGAGEQSGRLSSCFLKLGVYYEERARLLRRLMAGLAYPVFLIHMAILVFPVSSLQALVTQGNVFSFLFSKLLMLMPLYGLAALGGFLAQGSRGEVLKAAMDQVLHRVPVLGGARSSMALARLCLALEALISAGTNTIHAWELAGAACGSPRFQRAIRSFRPGIESGQTPAELVGMAGVFPDEFVQQVHSAEMSGKTDEVLTRMHRFYEDQASRRFTMAITLLGALIFGVVVITVAWQVISFWLGYFGQIGQAIS